MSWAQNNNHFTNEAKSEFATIADGWLVAYAKTNNMTIVTHEVYDPNIKRRIKIPNACEEFQIEYINTFEMLKTLEVQFGLLESV